MSKGAWSFKPAELRRALRVAADAGLQVVAYEIKNGAIVVQTRSASATSDTEHRGRGNDWDSI
jgi:hypothetical protein